MLQNGGGMTAAAESVVIETTTQGFVKDVIEESKRQPVLVDFWAPWCGPCKQLTPILEKAVKAAKGKVKLVKMNIDEHPAIPGQMGIQSIPAVIAFANGQPVDGFMGALPESQVIAFLERVTKGKIGAEEKDLMKAADEALAAGNAAEAANLYGQLLTQDGGNVAALAGLARCYVADRQARAGQADARHGAGGQAQRRRRSPPRAPRSKSPSRPNRSGRSTSWRRRSPPIRSIIRRASISPPRSTPRASARKPPTICSRSSSATANGTRTARASSSCSFSRPGARPTRPPWKAASGCRRFCLRDSIRRAGTAPAARSNVQCR